MRILKGVLTGVLALALGFLWTQRAWVTTPYTEERGELEFTLDGLDLTIEPTDVNASPYRLPVAEDTGTVALAVRYPVAPPPAESAAMAGGSAGLGGTVSFAGAPIPGAIVRVERAVLGDSSIIDVGTDEQGEWQLAGLRGGRYRVRAFVPGQYASESSAVLFVDAGSTHELVTPVVAASEGVTPHFFGPEEINIGGTGTIAVTLTAESVDAEGRLTVSSAVGSTVIGSVSGVGSLLSADVVATDAEGTVRFLIRCDDVGRGLLTVNAAGVRSSFVLPPCRVPAPPPTDGSDDVNRENDGAGSGAADD